MSHLLLRPHVANANRDITSPDVLIDRVWVDQNGSKTYLPIQRLSQKDGLQMPAGPMTVTAAGLWTAAGGGPVFTIAVGLRPHGAPLQMADFIVSRGAWRWRNVIEHWSSCRLSVVGTQTEQFTLSTEQIPAAIDEPSSTLPRSVALLTELAERSFDGTGTHRIEIRLSDPATGLELTQGVMVHTLGDDDGSDRLAPRYAVGPAVEVEHYI
ncbi:MAG: hypothetical protein AAGH76_04620 [Pseudomonadota bacterium]